MKERKTAPPERTFDEGYYRKYYEDPRTRVTDAAGRAPLADFLFAYLKYLRIPIRRVLDLGCGIGLWRREVLRHHPKARYTGVEKSEYACRKYGWQQGSVTTYRPRTPFDLVLCHDVVQYLTDAEADAALRNLAALTRSALHLEILTREDWENNCDQTVTDGKVYLRSAAWYRRRLKKDFLACGGGLFLLKDKAPALYEFEYLA
ncbi:MAG TPA: class I SAM-dependent methyltransferase [Thermoanaerobaculia bacterium]|jgi:trans-aconitate methyltransferase